MTPCVARKPIRSPTPRPARDPANIPDATERGRRSPPQIDAPDTYTETELKNHRPRCHGVREKIPPQIEAPDKCTGTEFQKTIAPQTGYPNLPSPTPLPTPAPTTTDLTTLRRTTANKGPLTPSTQLPRPTSHIRALKRHVTTRPMARTKSTTTRRRQRAPQMSPTPPPPTAALPNPLPPQPLRSYRDPDEEDSIMDDDSTALVAVPASDTSSASPAACGANPGPHDPVQSGQTVILFADPSNSPARAQETLPATPDKHGNKRKRTEPLPTNDLPASPPQHSFALPEAESTPGYSVYSTPLVTTPTQISLTHHVSGACSPRPTATHAPCQ